MAKRSKKPHEQLLKQFDNAAILDDCIEYITLYEKEYIELSHQ